MLLGGENEKRKKNGENVTSAWAANSASHQ